MTPLVIRDPSALLENGFVSVRLPRSNLDNKTLKMQNVFFCFDDLPLSFLLLRRLEIDTRPALTSDCRH